MYVVLFSCAPSLLVLPLFPRYEIRPVYHSKNSSSAPLLLHFSHPYVSITVVMQRQCSKQVVSLQFYIRSATSPLWALPHHKRKVCFLFASAGITLKRADVTPFNITLSESIVTPRGVNLLDTIRGTLLAIDEVSALRSRVIAPLISLNPHVILSFSGNGRGWFGCFRYHFEPCPDRSFPGE